MITKDADGPDGIQWQVRSYQEGDEPGMVALLNLCNAHDGIGHRLTEEEMRISHQQPGVDPHKEIVIVEGQSSEDSPEVMFMGMGRVTSQDDTEKRERVYHLRLSVHPSARGSGLERVVARELATKIHVSEHSGEKVPMESVVLRAVLSDKQKAYMKVWGELGLRQEREYFLMARALDEPIEPAKPVAGVTIRHYRRPQDDAATLSAINEAYAKHWDYQPMSEDEYRGWLDSDPNLRLDLTWLAEVEREPGAIAGFCACYIREEANKHTGRAEGWIGGFGLGTIPSWQRKGLGRSLLLHALQSLADAGMEVVLLNVDSDSLTNAPHLYESIGFKVRESLVHLGAPLADVKL